MGAGKCSDKSLEKVTSDKCEQCKWYKMTHATYNKCGQCKWLNGEQRTVGIECTNPDKVWRHRTSKYHYRSTKACKMFCPKEG